MNFHRENVEENANVNWCYRWHNLFSHITPSFVCLLISFFYINVDMTRIILSDMVPLHELEKVTLAPPYPRVLLGKQSQGWIITRLPSWVGILVQGTTCTTWHGGSMMTSILLGQFVSVQFSIFPGNKNRFNILHWVEDARVLIVKLCWREKLRRTFVESSKSQSRGYSCGKKPKGNQR